MGVDEGDNEEDAKEVTDKKEDKDKKKKKKKENKSDDKEKDASPVRKAIPVKEQTSPPTIPISEIYPDKFFPVGEIMEHPLDCNTYRITSKEKKRIGELDSERLRDIREAAEAHRHARYDLQKWLKPGLS